MSGCNVQSNTPLHVSGEVIAQTASSYLAVTLHAVVLNQYIPLALPQDVADGCNATQCPLVPQSTVRIEATLNIDTPDIIRGLTVPIELAVTNESSDRIFCVRTWVTVVS